MSENDVTPVARAEFLRLLDVQEAKGVETYGVTLQAGNGRDALNDAAEEIVDAFKYVVQARMELAASREREQRLTAAFSQIVEAPYTTTGDTETILDRCLGIAHAAIAAETAAAAREPRVIVDEGTCSVCERPRDVCRADDEDPRGEEV